MISAETAIREARDEVRYRVSKIASGCVSHAHDVDDVRWPALHAALEHYTALIRADEQVWQIRHMSLDKAWLPELSLRDRELTRCSFCEKD